MGSKTSCQVSSPAMARLSSIIAVLKPFSSRYALSALRSALASSPVSVRILQNSSSSRKIRFSMEILSRSWVPQAEELFRRGAQTLSQDLDRKFERLPLLVQRRYLQFDPCSRGD